MKHLCIINPMAGRVAGHVNELVEEIEDFFARNSRMDYKIHVTRWKRDASGYVMRYVSNAREMVRVYAIGGGGTLFEVINGVMGLPNVQVAYYPMGNDDDFLTIFGKNARSEFTSMRNLSLSPVIPVDTILAGNHYVASVILIGLEAVSYLEGLKLSEKFRLPLGVGYLVSGFYYSMIKSLLKSYRIEMEGFELENEYTGIFIGNISSHGAGYPAPEASFNDGYMDVYTLKPVPKSKVLAILKDYQSGHYNKWPGYITHYRCKKLRITSLTDMTVALDGEIFFDNELKLEICPSSLNLVCPWDMAEPFYNQNATEGKKQADKASVELGQTQEVKLSDLFVDGDGF